MSIEVNVPTLPESVADATIATWHKKVGDAVKRDENILDLETDKVVLEVPAPADGILTACLFDVGATVNSGQVLARIETGNVAVSTPATASPVVPQKQADDVSDQSTSPAVRRLLAEHALDPTMISGSGKEGRITKDDVVSFITSSRERPLEPQAVSAAVAPSSTHVTSGTREERRVPMSRLRAKVAERHAHHV